MDKTQNTKISLNNIYAFIDPSAKGADRGIFHLFVAGKDGFGMFIHNGKKHFVNELQNNPQKIVYYAPFTEKNLYDQPISNGVYGHACNNIAEILLSNFVSINGIEKDAIKAIRPIKNELVITLDTCRLYENLFACVQKRVKENKSTTQKTLEDFCM